MHRPTGSPNAILREAIDGKVILRTGRRIPGVRPVGGVHAPIAVVRMAVDDAYGAREWREEDESEFNGPAGSRGQQRRQSHFGNDSRVDRLFDDQEVAYLHVRNTEAGCFIAQLDRAGGTT